MELELKQTRLTDWEDVVDTTVYREETADTIVPDACPDILELLDTCGEVFLKSTSTADGHAQISGVMRCTVLYLPENGACVEKLDTELPFSCTLDAEGITPESTVCAQASLKNAETRISNPRKVLIRAEAGIKVQVYAPRIREIAGEAVTRSTMGVEQCLTQQEVSLISCVAEKTFHFADDFSLPNRCPDAEKLLTTWSTIHPGESRLIGNKLIFKGEVALHVLYRAQNGLACADFSLPYSQIMEMNTASEDNRCAVEVGMRDVRCDPGEDGRSFALSLELAAQAVLTERRTLEVLTDLYSTAFEMEVTGGNCCLSTRREEEVRRETCRTFVETEHSVRDVLRAQFLPGAVRYEREGERVKVTAEGQVSALFSEEDGALSTLRRECALSAVFEVPQEEQISCRLSPVEEVTVSPSGNGAEIRLEGDLICESQHREEITAVDRAILLEETPLDNTAQPSIILRRVSGEKIWEIAKHYATTAADILRANELSPGEEIDGRVLLIPRRR